GELCPIAPEIPGRRGTGRVAKGQLGIVSSGVVAPSDEGPAAPGAELFRGRGIQPLEPVRSIRVDGEHPVPLFVGQGASYERANPTAADCSLGLFKGAGRLALETVKGLGALGIGIGLLDRQPS